MNIMKEAQKNYEHTFSKENKYKQEFKEEEFIVLRKIYENNLVEYFLVIHLQSLYIFMMEKICTSYIGSSLANKRINREINILMHPHKFLTYTK